MAVCCVSGCKTGLSSPSKMKIYRIPCGRTSIEKYRRRLWLQAIERVNGSIDDLTRNSRICGAHFKSHEVSLDHTNPDFVPSVFTCSKQRRRRKVKGAQGCRKSQRLTSNGGMEEKTTTPPRVEIEEKNTTPPRVEMVQKTTTPPRVEMVQKTTTPPRVEMEEKTTTPPRVDSPMDLQSSVLMEEKQTPKQTPSTSSVPQDEETLTEEPETETTPVKSQTTFSPDKVSPSFKAPAGIPKLGKRSIIVRLKHIYVPASGYQCEQCNESFTDTSQLMKHKKQHEEEISFVCETCEAFFSSRQDFTAHQCEHEPSFPCNVCDRSFTTSHNLKRHKLLHVKDGRKCPTCGVLFCRRHNHILFLPSAETITEYEEDYTTAEPKNVADRILMPENHLQVKPEPNHNADLDPDARSSSNVLPGPLSKTGKTPASRERVSSVLNLPVFSKHPFMSSLPPPVPEGSRKHRKSPWLRPNRPASLVQPLFPQHADLPPSLKLFSPLYLTSAFLKVKRNYEYILSKPIGVNKNIVKEEPCELPLISPD